MKKVFDSNIKNVVIAYNRLLNIKIADSSIAKSIDENPFYPSLLSISDVFDIYNIKHNSFRISNDQLEDVKVPYIAFLDIPSKGSDFVLVTQITKNNAYIIYDKKKPEKIEVSLFRERFKNVVLIVQPNESYVEKDYEYKIKVENSIKLKKNIWFTAIVITVFLALFTNLTDTFALPLSIISFIKLLGLICTGLLVAYEIEKDNRVVNRICKLGGNTKCDDVLSSKMSKIWGTSWSEIGFFYFSSTTVILFFPGFSFYYKVGLLAINNVLATPYIIFSIYYQWRIIKQWCLLCLAVQTILATELIFNILFYWIPIHSIFYLKAGGIKPLFQLATFIMFPILIWYGIKPFLVRSKEFVFYKDSYRRFHYNPIIFNSLLMQQDKASDGFLNLGICIGNPSGNISIIKVCSPYCGPCAHAHSRLGELIMHNENVKLRVIFTGTDLELEARVPIIKHLLAFAGESDIIETQKALDDWYLSSTKDYFIFADKYPIKSQLNLQNSQVEAMSAWCLESEVTYTPTIFVNGYKLPENYEIEDLKYVL